MARSDVLRRREPRWGNLVGSTGATIATLALLATLAWVAHDSAPAYDPERLVFTPGALLALGNDAEAPPGGDSRSDVIPGPNTPKPSDPATPTDTQPTDADADADTDADTTTDDAPRRRARRNGGKVYRVGLHVRVDGVGRGVTLSTVQGVATRRATPPSGPQRDQAG